MERKQAIVDVSEKLRRKAQIAGIEIDDIYRNVAGITFQMYSMESAYVGYTVRKPATKLFIDIVRTMKENRKKYDDLLQEAMRLIDTDKSLREKYLDWLSSKGLSAQMSELYIVYAKINEFCLSRKVLKKPLFETTDMAILSNVRSTIDDNRIFRFKYKRQISKMSVAIRYYIHFIKEENEKQTLEDNLSDIEKQEESIVHREDVQDVAIDTAEYITVDAVQRKKAFIDWMLANGLSAGTVRPYVASLVLSGKMAQENGIISTDIFNVTDAEILKNAFGELMKNQEFIEKNELRHNQFRAAWGKYVQFSGDPAFDPRTVITEVIDADGEIKKENAALYMRLKSMASVYDDVNGFSIEWIRSMLGLSIETEELKKVIDEVSWITEVDEGIYSFTKNTMPIEQKFEFDKESFVRVLMMRYQNGMKFDSIDLENFRETYSDIIGDELSLTDKKLEICLRKCGVLFKDRVFPAEGIINNSVKDKLMDYISSSFANGKQVLYYKAIYSDLSDAFDTCFNLTDEMMLKPYLEYICEPGDFYFAEEYLSKEKHVKIDHSAEIEEFMLSMGKPLSYDEIYAGLSHVSKEVIYREIKTNPNIVLNEKEHYYHYGMFECSSEDADRILKYISNDIEEDGYCIWSHVFVKIQETMPLFLENNIYLSSLGIRNAIAKKLSGRYSFDSEVICTCGQALNMSAVYRLYGQHHVPFSDDDIYEFAKEVSGGCIYFDSLSENTVRVSKHLFVAKENIEFDVEAIDRALTTYFATGYMMIKDIDSFLVFPNVGFEWNVFLLESYLMYYSSEYALSNNGRSLNNVAGAVVRKGSGYDDFVDVCADVLANSDCPLTKQKALDYLAELKLLTRRSYSKMDSALVKARQIRNRKG